jgi:hypothetical protein
MTRETMRRVAGRTGAFTIGRKLWRLCRHILASIRDFLAFVAIVSGCIVLVMASFAPWKLFEAIFLNEVV